MKKFIKPELFKLTKHDDKKSPSTIQTFRFEKLERGFANTIGVALRRTLLSSIPGLSSFAIKVEGIEHEFRAVPNTKQDMVEIILAIKDLVLKPDYNIVEIDQIYELTISVDKAGTITAGNITAPPGIKVVNKKHFIAELTTDEKFEMTIYVRLSTGFETFEENGKQISELIPNVGRGLVAIDSNYSPVKKVSHNTSILNLGEKRVFESLDIEIETDGSVTPEESITFASRLLRDYLDKFDSYKNIILTEGGYMVEEEIKNENEDQLKLSIRTLNLSVRSENALKNSGIETIGELIDRTVQDLSEIKNLGEKSKTEIIQTLSNNEISFKPEE